MRTSSIIHSQFLLSITDIILLKYSPKGEGVNPIPANYINQIVDQNLSHEQLLSILETTLKEKNDLELENHHLIEKIKLLEAKLFAKLSEKYKKDIQVFDEAKAKLEEIKEDKAFKMASKTLDENTKNIDIETLEKESKTGGRKPIPQKYDRVDVIHDLKEDEKVCECGCALSKIGEDVSEQLDIIPAMIYVKRHRRLKYACKKCQENVKIAPVQNQSVPKCLAAPGLLAHTAVLKFDDHLPLYRQSEIWERLGVDISRSTLSSWILKTGDALTPLVKSMQNHIVKSGYVKADESTLQVLKTPGKKDTSNSYMWVYMTGNDVKPAVVYEYQEGRHGDFAKSFLNGFKGVLQTDGYSGYNAVTEQEDVISQGCFAHSRRKFFDVWNIAQKEGVASKSLEIISKLYDIEREIKDLSSSEKYTVRHEKAKPILDSFHVFLNEVKLSTQKKGLLDKAISYTLNQWDALTHYLNDGKIDIDNNAAERQIRPFAVGRKNWLFAGSPDGALAAANIYSLIESAKMNGLNPESYLRFILAHKIDESDQNFIQSLMPWNQNPTSLLQNYSPIMVDKPENLSDNLKLSP